MKSKGIAARIALLALVFGGAFFLRAVWRESSIDRSCRPSQVPAAAAEALQRRGAAACPGGEGYRPLSNLHPVESVLVGYHGANPGYIRRLASILRKHEPGVILNILIPQRAERASVPRGADEGVMERAGRDLRRIFADRASWPHIRFLPVESVTTLWPQDFLLPGVTSGDRPALLAMPYSRGPAASGELASACALEHLPPAYPGKERSSADYGGNIEPYPGGVLAIGEGLAREIRDRLEEGGSELLDIRTRWLKLGHVDEILSLVPLAEGPRRCRFAVPYSSPEAGIAAVRRVASEDPDQVIAPPLPAGETRPDTGKSRPSCLRTMFDAEGGLTAGAALGCDEFIRANLDYERIIESDLYRLAGRIRRRTGCAEVRTIPLPQLYLPAWSTEGRYGEGGDGAVAVNPNPVNSLVLTRNIVVPEPFVEEFRREIRERLGPSGLRVHFVDNRLYHYRKGQVHCSTNALRACR